MKLHNRRYIDLKNLRLVLSSNIFQDLNKEELLKLRSSHTMAEEAKQFPQVEVNEIKTKTYQNYLDAATTVHRVLFSMRQDAGIDLRLIMITANFPKICKVNSRKQL